MQPLSISLILMMICQFSGCAKTYPPAPATPAQVALTTEVGALPIHQANSELAVGADPYYSNRQQSRFGLDMSQMGILPISVYLKNQSVHPLTVVPGNISLKFRNGLEVKPTDPLTAAEKLGGLKAGQYVLMAAALGVTAVSIHPIGVITATRIKDVHERKKDNLRKEYQDKELREVTLAKGESTQGFVYFYIAQGIQHAPGAHLIVPYLTAKGRAGEVRVPLGGM